MVDGGDAMEEWKMWLYDVMMMWKMWLYDGMRKWLTWLCDVVADEVMTRVGVVVAVDWLRAYDDVKAAEWPL